MTYYVYAIKSLLKNYIYVWLTKNLERRFNQHNSGQNKTTKPYTPYKIIYEEKYITRNEARIKEKYFKSWCGKEFLKWIK
jgi:putative endonuclease